MALELIRDLITIDRVIGEEMTQAVVEGDIVVPDSKPDVHRILSVNGEVIITDKEIVEEKVIVEGVVNMKSLYISEEGTEPLNYMEGSFSFAQHLMLPGVKSRMEVEIKATVEHVDSSILNSRKLNVKCVLCLVGKAIEKPEISVIKEIKGIEDVQVLKSYIDVNDIVGENISRITVRQDLKIPTDRPVVDEIVYTDVTLGDWDSSVLENKIALNGILNVTTLFTGGDAGAINCVKSELPFSHYIEIDGAMPGMRERVHCYVEDYFSTLKEDEEGEKRTIEYEVVVNTGGKVETVRPTEVLIDAYSPASNIETEKSNLRYKKALDWISEDIIIREELDIRAGLPQIGDICDIKAKPMLTDSDVYENQAIVEGVIALQMLYTALEPAGAINIYEDEIPFRHSVQLAEEDGFVDLNVDLRVVDLQYRVLEAELFEIRVRVKADIALERTYEKEILLNIEEIEPAERTAESSIVIYFIKPGDQLWNIAKRFNTTIEDLVNINEIETPGDLQPGERLIIPRIVKYQLN